MTMNKAILCAAMAVFSCSAMAAGSHAVKGHTTKNGTYVPPTRATNPNKTKTDNYSSKGNVNPATGTPGKVDPYKPAK
jgi:hypothetical protein